MADRRNEVKKYRYDFVDDFEQNFAEICFIGQKTWKFATKQGLKPHRLLSSEKCCLQKSESVASID